MLATLRKILRLNAPRRITPAPRRFFLRAKYDAALTTDNNRRHWANADGLSANAANSPQVRRTLRNRARYEVANNSYARGIVLTLANDTIGTGPRLQMLSEDAVVNRAVETAFCQWATAARLAEKLRTLRMARAEDGEAFGVFTSNPVLESPVKLDVKLVEAEQVCTPDMRWFEFNAVDGIVFDSFGNPSQYHVLRQHPGEPCAAFHAGYDPLPAAAVVHYFRLDRPGQARGIPELTPALPLFALLREYTLATLDAAKAAAYFAGILYTDAPASGEADAVEPMDSIELERNLLLTMPGGWKMSQVHAEQPASTYGEFKREILNEIARCLNMPFNIAAGNSSGYNYSSGRLDHQTYYKAIRVEQSLLGTVVLDRIFSAWVNEAARVEGLLPQAARTLSADLTHQWFWDGHDHVDPQKESAAQATRLANHTTTLAEEYARRGRDWEAEIRQRAKESALLSELGLSTPALQPQPQAEPEMQERAADA